MTRRKPRQWCKPPHKRKQLWLRRKIGEGGWYVQTELFFMYSNLHRIH